jgi:predicted ATP-dependent endonuclease of OLD family
VHVRSFRVENFRRLKNVRVDLDDQTTIFVGANNSGKTSATHVFQRFLDPKAHFQIYDFTADCWDLFNKFDPASGNAEADLPKIYFDLWFDVDDGNLHRVVNLLPGLDWDGQPVGVRMVYAPRDPESLVANYRKAKEGAKLPDDKADASYKPWPQSLTDYLSKRLISEYEIRYYLLDARQCDDDLAPKPGYAPFYLGSGDSGGRAIVSSLIRVDFLNAQRHLTDESHGRAEDLSHRLGKYYQRNLPKFEADLEALSAIANSENSLNQHFANAFDDLLTSIEKLGYPGSSNPGLVVKASFSAKEVLSASAQVHYALPDGNGGATVDPSAMLPDQYNGLGFKNLIYMAVEIRDFHCAWAESEGERPPVHLIMIEEPEAHLHAQLQQVFIRRVFDLLPEPETGFQTQMVVTTHSSHILYERSFDPIRYFCRSQVGTTHCSDVKNLSVFCNGKQDATRKFLQQYLKLTHCDLFFADAAILVEGNVERLLLPLIIQRDVQELRACHLTILEVGGAFAHIFQSLLEFLEITTLVITDLDSVAPVRGDEEPKDDEDPNEGEACMTTVPAAVTSNETLKQWFPKLASIDELLDLGADEKFVETKAGVGSHIRVAYQTRRPTQWRRDSAELAGRTLEEAFALENLSWTQQPSRRQSIGLFIPKSDRLTLEELHEKIFKRVRGSFDKTKFALGLMADQDGSWTSPQYIVDGLEWLRGELGIQPTPPDAPAPDDEVKK